MPSGKAYGNDREYQLLCRDILMREYQDLALFEGDGIDVPFEVGGTVWTLDIALRDQEGNLIVAECRRWKDVIKQEALAALAYKVEQVRKHLDLAVAAVFFTRSTFQVGALKVAEFEDMTTIVCDQGQEPEHFRVRYLRYDPEREKRVERMVYHYTGGNGVLTPEGRQWLEQLRMAKK